FEGGNADYPVSVAQAGDRPGPRRDVVDAVRGADPGAVLAIQGDPGDLVVGQARRHVDPDPRPVGQVHHFEAGVVAAEPQVAARGVEGESVDAAADQALHTRGVLRLVVAFAAPDLEAVAVEA